MSTDEIPPEIGFYFDAMSAPLADASTQYQDDDRFQTIATLLPTISAEWTEDNAQTGRDLDTLGQTLTDLQQSHPADSNVTSLVRFYVALEGVRSDPQYSPGKPPMAPAVVPSTAKLTVFDVAGTSAASVLTAGGAPTTAQTPPSWNLANMVNKNLITVEEVPYPACVPFGTSCQAGANTLLTMISQTTGPFAMVGTSQGAMVIASVYQTLLDNTGPVAGRIDDFKLGVTYGNPCRKKGSIAPNCEDPGGQGINVDSWLMTTVEPDRWWDFVNPGDPAACNGAGPWTVGAIPYDYQGQIGDLAAGMFLEMYRTLSSDINALLGQLNPPPNMILVLISLFNTLLGVAGPHSTYDKTKPDSTQPGLTCTQLAVQKLNAIAAAL
jgi:hypothetical protein